MQPSDEEDEQADELDETWHPIWRLDGGGLLENGQQQVDNHGHLHDQLYWSAQVDLVGPRTRKRTRQSVSLCWSTRVEWSSGQSGHLRIFMLRLKSICLI